MTMGRDNRKKIFYAVIRKWGEEYQETVMTEEFTNKNVFANHLRDLGYAVRLVFSNLEYEHISRIIKMRGMAHLNKTQKDIYEAYNDTLPRRNTP